MNRRKKLISYLLIIVIIVSGLFGTYNFYKINKTNNDYIKYFTEAIEIPIKLTKRNRENYTNDPSAPNLYQIDYQEYFELYKTLKEKASIYGYEFRFSNIMHIMYSKDTQFDIRGLFYSREIENLEGRNFTQDELDNGAKVIIVNKSFADKHGLNIGDLLTLDYDLKNDLTSKVEVELIGIYDNKDDNWSALSYMPGVTTKQISDTWLYEMYEIYSKDILTYYNPVNLYHSDITCYSEEQYEKVNDFLYEYRREGYLFDLARKEVEHYKDIDEFDTSEYEKSLYTSIDVLIVSLIVLVIYQKYKEKSSVLLEKDLKKKIIKEKEKNVQDIFQMNQETHQLKHDMKHFLIQLSSLIENGDKDKSLEYIKEYYSDIEALEIPVYTLNSTLDLLINHYSKKASEMDIDFTYSGNLINELKVNERKLFILLSNALDNAFNHCNENKTVNFSLTYVEPYHRFIIVNNFDKKKEMNQDKEHGYGLISMKKLVDELKGELIIEEKDNKFICTILIP